MLKLKGWFCGIIRDVSSFSYKDQAASLWAFAAIYTLEGLGTGPLIRVMKKSVFAVSICIFTLGGAAVGSMVGAMKGQTTETGFLRGSIVGAVAGAITALQLLDTEASGEPLSKVDLLNSLLEGKTLVEWVSPVLKAYQWQSTPILEPSYGGTSDIYESSAGVVRGLSEDCIQKLPEFTFQSKDNIDQQCCPEFCCSICLQDFKDGDSMREIPYCGHLFHLDCIDKWLARNGSCPICRNYL